MSEVVLEKKPSPKSIIIILVVSQGLGASTIQLRLLPFCRKYFALLSLALLIFYANLRFAEIHRNSPFTILTKVVSGA